MKLTVIVPSVFFALVAQQVVAGPSPPEITIGLNTATAGSSALGGIEPGIKWQTSGKFGDYDVEGGINTVMKDVDALPPYSLWGRVKRNISGFGLSLRGDISSSSIDKLDLDFQCAAPSDTKVQVQASVGKNDLLTISKVKATQAMDVLDGVAVLSPTYSVASGKADLSLAYARDEKQSFQVDFNSNLDARLTIMQKIRDGHVVRPSISSDGDWEIDYEADVEKGFLTTTYKPNSHINFKWQDGPWVANFKCPMDGYYGLKNGVQVSVKTKVDLDLNKE